MESKTQTSIDIDVRGTIVRLDSNHPIFSEDIGSRRLYFQKTYHTDTVSLDVEPSVLHRMIDLAVARSEADANPTIQTCLSDMELDFSRNHWWKFAAEQAMFSVADPLDDLSPPSEQQFKLFFPMFHWKNHPWTVVDRTVILAIWCCRNDPQIVVSPIRSLDYTCPWAPLTVSQGFLIRDTTGLPDIEVELTKVSIDWQHKSIREPLSMEDIHKTLTQFIQKRGNDLCAAFLCRLVSTFSFYNSNYT